MRTLALLLLVGSVLASPLLEDGSPSEFHTVVKTVSRKSVEALNVIYFALPRKNLISYTYILVAVGLSGILKAKQKLCVTLNSDKLGGIDLKKKSKLTMCSA